MAKYDYVIVGGGMTADAATQGVRELDPNGSIAIIGSEPDPPYSRPPLTKGLWKGEEEDSVWLEPKERGVELLLGRTVQRLDPAGKSVVDDQGTAHTYRRLLLATGGTPRRLPFGGDDIIYYRTYADYRRLRELCERGKDFAVIGGGFIGSEIAAALAMNGKHVTMVFPEASICDRVFPADLGAFVTDYYRSKGVEVQTGATVAGMERRDGRLTLQVQDAKSGDRREVVVDGVVAGLGIQPNVQLAGAAGLAVENGIVVDEFLRTSRPDIYAAGDVAAFVNPALGRRLRVEHEDNALTMGKCAGHNLAGHQKAYTHLPYFYSDLFDLGYEAVGDLDSRLETVADWQEEHHEGVVYYLKEGRVRGVLLWNVWEQVDAARDLIAEPGPFTPSDLSGRLAPVE